MDTSNVDQRHTKLSKLFESVIRGQTKLTTSRQALLFIEAICCQPEKSSCAYKLINNSDGLFSIQVCVRADLSVPFLNGPAVDLLRYFEDPDLRAIDAGNVLKEILLNIVQPPFFWNSFISALRKGELLERAIHSYAWLLCELLLLLPWEDAHNYFVQAGDEVLLDRILNAQDPDTRSLGYKLSMFSQHMLLDPALTWMGDRAVAMTMTFRRSRTSLYSRLVTNSSAPHRHSYASQTSYTQMKQTCPARQCTWITNFGYYVKI